MDPSTAAQRSPTAGWWLALLGAALMALSAAFAWAVQPGGPDFPIHAAGVPLPFLILGRGTVRYPTIAHAVVPLAVACLVLTAWPRHSPLLDWTRRILGVVVLGLAALFVVRLASSFQGSSVVTALRAGWYLAMIGGALTVAAGTRPRTQSAAVLPPPPPPPGAPGPGETPGEPSPT